MYLGICRDTTAGGNCGNTSKPLNLAINRDYSPTQINITWYPGSSGIIHSDSRGDSAV
jgi:hypothetical protein